LLCHLDKVGELVKKLVSEVATLVGLFLRADLGEELVFERKEACLLPLFLRCAEEACDNSTYGAMPTGRTRALRRFDFSSCEPIDYYKASLILMRSEPRLITVLFTVVRSAAPKCRYGFLYVTCRRIVNVVFLEVLPVQ
jgi:hypothetical protein